VKLNQKGLPLLSPIVGLRLCTVTLTVTLGPTFMIAASTRVTSMLLHQVYRMFVDTLEGSVP